MYNPPPELLPYLDEEGRVTRWATRRHVAHQNIILAYLAEKFEAGVEYSEREVNAILKAWHTFKDWALLRRELFERGWLNRLPDGTKYWRTPSVKIY